jgi:hypothetical protein
MHARQAGLPILAILATSLGLLIGQADGVLEAILALFLLPILVFSALRHNPFIPGQIKSSRVRATILAIGGVALLIKIFAHIVGD